MATFRDIWNLVVTGDTSDVERKVKGLGQTAETTGATVDTTFRGRMSASLGNFAEKIPGVSGLMEKFGVTSSQAGAVLGTAVAGGAAAAGAAVEKFLASSVDEFQNQAQSVLHFKEVTGLAADESSRFVAVADDYAVSAEDLSAAVGKLDKTAGTAPQNLAKLGIEIAHNKDGAYDASQTFLNVVEAYNATDDASKKAAIAQGAFGKQWQGLVKLLDVGSGAIRTSLDSVKDYQLFSDKDLKKSEDYRHSLDDLNDAVKGLERSIGEALIPVLTEAAKKATDSADGLDKTLKPLGGIKGTAEKAAEGIFGFVKTMVDGLNPLAQYNKLIAEGKDIYGHFSGANDEAKNRLAEFYHVQDEATRALDDAAAASHEAELATRAHKREMDKVVDTGHMYGETNAGITKALDDQRVALEKATLATDNFRAAQRNLYNDQLGLQGSIYSSLDAIDAYRAKVADTTTTSREQEQANIAVQSSFDAVAQKAIDTAAQQAVLHGAVLTANGALDAQLSALREVAKELGPEDGKVRAELDLYMLALFNIPGQIVTNVDLQGTGLDTLGRAIGGTRREGSGAGGGYSTPAEVVGAVKTYEQSNGTSWRTGPQ